jgi:hypothetical protein
MSRVAGQVRGSSAEKVAGRTRYYDPAMQTAAFLMRFVDAIEAEDV